MPQDKGMGNTSPTVQDFFQLISDPTEKMTIIYDLIKSGGKIMVKNLEPDGGISLYEPRSIQGSELFLKPAKDHASNAVIGSEVVIQFQVHDHKYICQVPMNPSPDGLRLQMGKKLFRIQRREHFRIHFPAGFKASLTIQEVSGIKVGKILKLVDLSGGGCKVQGHMEEIDIPVGIAFDAILKIPDRKDFQLKCVIKHRGASKDRSTGKLNESWLGIQFIHSSEKESSRISASVMDLYRELFSRM